MVAYLTTCLDAQIIYMSIPPQLDVSQYNSFYEIDENNHAQPHRNVSGAPESPEGFAGLYSHTKAPQNNN